MRSSKNIPDGDLSLSIEALKRKVLDAAVRGELTEQLAEDGTAKDLLMQISDEKRRLVAEGKIKKEKALPAISDEEIPFEIPENWEWVRLGDLCTKFVDGSHFPPPNVSKGYPVISAKNIQNRKVSFNNITRFAAEDDFIVENKRTNISRGDIILAIVASIGKVAIYDDDRLIIAQRSVAILDSLISNHYLAVVFESPYCQKLFLDKANGTAQKGVYLNALAQFVIPLPPLAEQHRIVKRIDDAFHQLDELKKLQDAYSSNLDALRKKVIEEGIKGNLTERQRDDGTAAELLKEIEAEKQELIKTGKIKKEKPLPEITEEEKPFEIPESWEWVRLGNISNFGTNISVEPNAIGNDEWLLELEDIEKETGNILTRKKKSECNPQSTKHKFRKGNVLYSKMRPYLNKVLVADDDGYCTSEIHVLDFGKYILPTYARMYLQSPDFLAYANDHSYGDKPRLKTIDGRLAVFPLPPLAEQRRIVKRIEQVMKLI